MEIVAPLLRGKALFVAFNKSIATELGERLKGTPVSASTIHSAGFRALRNTYRGVQVAGDKYRKMLDALIREGENRGTFAGERLTNSQENGLWGEIPMYNVATKVVDLARLTLVSPSSLQANEPLSDSAWRDIESMAFHYGIDLQPCHEGWLRIAIPYVLAQGATMARSKVDFTDMLWLPVIDPAVRENLERYDWLLVDECQDLNACQLASESEPHNSCSRVFR